MTAAGAGLTACTSGSSASPSSASGPRTHDVVAFGATGNGRTDDGAAITRALGAMRRGDTLTFPAGRTFCHAGVLSVQTPGVRLRGPGTLLATTESASALKIEADDVTVDSLHLSIARTTQRWSAPDQHKLYLGSHTGITIDSVVIDGSAAAGLFCDGSSNFRLSSVRVSDTRADGIHMTNGARNGRVQSPRLARTGDDGVAVVSYLSDAAECHDIVVTDPQVRTTTGGRGVSVVGGHSVQYLEIDIDRSNAASVYIACEGGDFVTSSTRDVTVRGGRITGANTAAAADHGAVLIYSGRVGGMVSDVVVSGLTITGTRPTASRQIGVVADSAQDVVAGIAFEKMRLAASPTPYQGNAPTADVVLTDVTAAGARVAATK